MEYVCPRMEAFDLTDTQIKTKTPGDFYQITEMNE
jgi:hypothetical protein